MTNSTNELVTDGGGEPTHRVVGKYWQYGDTRYEPGDVCAPPDSALEHFPNRFEPLEDAPEPQDDGEPDDDDRVAVPDVGSMTNDDVEEYVAGQDDPRVLEAMLEDEQAGDDRTGAVEAIASRLDEVTE